MNIEEDLTSLKEIVAIRKERCHGFIESDSCFISTKRLETLLTAYEKEKEKNKELEDTRSIFNMGRRSYKNEIEGKIKARIEEIDKILKMNLIEKIRIHFEAQKEALQSLLEKE